MNLIYPMFAMVLLTLSVLVIMFRTRVGAVRSGEVQLGYFRTYSDNAPEQMIIVSRHFSNLFELPVLFYVACVVAMVRGFEGTVMIALAWVFVVARIFHAAFHIGSEKLPPRMAAFAVSVVAVFAMWITILIGVGI